MGALNVICAEIKTSFVFQEFQLKFTASRKIFKQMCEYSNLTQQRNQTFKKKHHTFLLSCSKQTNQIFSCPLKQVAAAVTPDACHRPSTRHDFQLNSRRSQSAGENQEKLSGTAAARLALISSVSSSVVFYPSGDLRCPLKMLSKS